MLRPELYTFEIGPELLAKLRPLIFETLWNEAERSQIKTLSISRAKELLGVAQPAFRELIPIEAQSLAAATLLPYKTMSAILHKALAESASFFRREGAQTFRDTQQLADVDARTTRLWTALFDRKLSRWLREQGYLDSPDSIESVDMVVEGVRAWVTDFVQRIPPGVEISPSAFFLDSESDLEATVALNGRKLRFRGRPDALIIGPSHPRPEVLEYKLGTQSQVELQVAQTVLYVSLVDAAKGTTIERARVQFFRFVGDTRPMQLKGWLEGLVHQLRYPAQTFPSSAQLLMRQHFRHRWSTPSLATSGTQPPCGGSRLNVQWPSRPHRCKCRST